MTRTPNSPSLTIIQRHVNERTAQIGRSLYSQIFDVEVFEVSDDEFTKTLGQAILLGSQAKSDWVLMTDGDVLPFASIRQMMHCASRVAKDVFVIEPLVFDKFTASSRRAGIHLYRKSALEMFAEEVQRLVRYDFADYQTTNRPETYLKKILVSRGYRRYWFGKTIGLHDFEQSYHDIYRTAYLYSRKYTTLIAQSIDNWRELALSDKDYLPALAGFSDGLIDTSIQKFTHGEYKEKWLRHPLAQAIRPKEALPQSFEALGQGWAESVADSNRLELDHPGRSMTEEFYNSRISRLSRKLMALVAGR